MKNFKSIQNLNIQKFLQIVYSGRIPYFCNSSKNILEFESCEWSEYWNCISKTPLSEDKSFQNFQESYLQYVQSQFLASCRTSFCLAYWQFLRKILISFQESPLLYSKVLQAIVGFGTFGIGFSAENPIAAGVFNLTHPVYQTAKLQISSRPESSKYLPLCAVYLPTKKNVLKLPEFYYYRQLAFGMREDARFLLCPAVNPEIRFSSFEVLHSFTERIHTKKDTRIQERSSFLVPVIRTTFYEETAKENSTFRVADIGGGTGHLFRGIIEKIEKDSPQDFRDNSIEWTIVERPGMNYRRHLFRVNFFKKFIK
ncbi:MAG: hypothetical protein Q4D98_14225 [Planctomycetia bacterium]|nr:hypothetical protein [Planctomycetia bacterium]